MFGEVLVFAAFLLLFGILILLQQTGAGPTGEASAGVAPAGSDDAGGGVEKAQPSGA